MEKVIPPGLNYADIKPEAIENQIRIIKYTPMATVQQANQNDVIRFHLQGNGFYDPYSAYLRVEVDFGDIPNPVGPHEINGKFIDRSAHSLFSRLVIRSQGTELERIEHYDVVAAMINDMVYSQEQRLLHHYEGFAHKQVPTTGALQYSTEETLTFQALSLLSSVSGGSCTHFGDVGAYKLGLPDKVVKDAYDETSVAPDTVLAIDQHGGPITISTLFDTAANYDQEDFGLALIADNSQNDSVIVDTPVNTTSNAQNPAIFSSPKKAVFCLPIYSGIIGILMPDKKLLPLSLLPLEVELTVNPYGMYAAGRNMNTRSFTITKCEIFSHTLFFEQELHRSLEAIVAETGIFLHYQSFYLGPVNTYSAIRGPIGGYNHIGVYLKSIQSIHWTYLYNSYEQDNGPRKLSFSSHNLQTLQVRNGMDLIPSEPIRGQVGRYAGTSTGVHNIHSQFLIETYKAWNKMHDPLSDSAITPYNFQVDIVPDEKPVTVDDLLNYQKHIGRCQYAVTLEGEELGQQKTIITGKKSVMPFDLNIDGYKGRSALSYMLLFLKADFICYVRPDLVVTRLGL